VELKRLIDYYSQHLSRAELLHRMAELARKARDHAVGTQLLIEEVKRRHIEVLPAEVDAAIQDMVKRVGGEDKLSALIARQGLTCEQFNASIKAGKQLDRLVDRIVSAEPECTEAEVREFFEKHADNYATEDKAQLRHILMRPASASEADKAATRSRLMAIRQQILEGVDFGDLAAAHSECPSGKESQGQLGWITRNTTLPQFDQAVFDNMEVGDISEVIETPLGLHIVEKLDQEDGEPIPYEEARERVRDLLTHERRGQALSRFVEKLRAGASIEEDQEDVTEEWETLLDSFLDGGKNS
jgi:parvulin-like peptidyl-prolyl isomerase